MLSRLFKIKTPSSLYAKYPGWHPYLLVGILHLLRWKFIGLRRKLAVWILPDEDIVASRSKDETTIEWHTGTKPFVKDHMWI